MAKNKDLNFERNNQTWKMHQYDVMRSKILLGLHLIGCEFYSSNICVDGYVKATRRDNSDCFSIVGNHGYSRNPNDVQWFLDNRTKGTYEQYMQKFYPEFKFVWKRQIKK